MTAVLGARTAPPRFRSVDALLDDARSRIDRYSVAAADAAVAAGARFVDIRPAQQRAAEGEIPGSLIVERNHLEWRLHPDSDARLPAADTVTDWIVVCSEGYTSSLAADSLLSIGVSAGDLVGGVTAWRESGRPVAPGPTPTHDWVPA